MRLTVTILLSVLLHAAAGAQTAAEKIAAMTEDKPAQVGVAWIAGGRETAVNNGGGYPLMSVFKLHGAVAALRRMERNGTPTDTVIRVKAGEMMQRTYSPLLKLHPGEDFSIPFDSLLHYSIAESDNNACDIIIRMAGGIRGVNAEMKAIGLDGYNISETEASMNADPARAYNNRSTPLSVARLLMKVYEGDIITGRYAELMRAALEATVTGENKMKAGLGPGMTLGHKTGTGFTLPDGTKTADYDAGAVTLADGRRVYIAVLIKDSRLSDEANARLTADITRAILSEALDL